MARFGYEYSLLARLAVRLLLAALFIFAGLAHLVHPALFLPVMPPWIPFHLFCIQLSGVFELLGGIGLLIPVDYIQVVTGWGLALLLIAVFPANVYMAVSHIKVHGIPIEPWMAWARLPLQFFLIFGVLGSTGAWPRNQA